jgi:hypothetical protein
VALFVNRWAVSDHVTALREFAFLARRQVSDLSLIWVDICEPGTSVLQRWVIGVVSRWSIDGLLQMLVTAKRHHLA